MNREDYERLCAACDDLLSANDATLPRIANPWLHIVREHPAFLRQYEDLFAEDSFAKIWHGFFRRQRSRMAGLRQVLRAIRSNRRPWQESGALPERIDILFVSHLISPNHAGNDDDFYFGSLPRTLLAQGHSVVIALINQAKTSASAACKKWQNGQVPRVILSDSLGIGEEWRIRQEMQRDARQLHAQAQSERSPFLRRVLRRAAEEGLANGTRTGLRMDIQIHELVKRLAPRVVVTTHEGHAWERIAFSAARRARKEILCFGYQHAALFRLQHAIRRRLNRGFDPDRILAPGLISKKQLEDSPSLAGMPITVLGSNRAFTGQYSLKAHSAGERLHCLVIPEGLINECHILFGFSLACARQMPHVMFIWRMHPILPFGDLISSDMRFKDLPPNVVVSSAALVDDLAKCQWALYRGTTAIIQAVMAGLEPIYLSQVDEMTIDPLYEIAQKRSEVTTVQDFMRVTQTFHEKGDDADRMRIDYAREYCGKFYTALDATVIGRLIPASDGVVP